MQEQINWSARKIVSLLYRANDHKFGYMHPDEYLRYLASDPCAGCEYMPLCQATDQVCLKYMTHFQEKLEFLRKRALSHEKIHCIANRR